MTGSAKQSIARHNGWMDCVASLAMTKERPLISVKTLRRNPSAKQILAAMKPFSCKLGKPLKPASANLQFAGRIEGFDHVDAGFEFVSRVLPGTAA
jgi:hypothetical protein